MRDRTFPVPDPRGIAGTAVRIGAATIAVALAATSAPGQTVFTDRTAFQAALSSYQTYSALPYCPATPPYCPTPVHLSAVGPLAVTAGDVWVKTYAPFQPYFGFEPDAPINDANFATFQSPTPLYALGVDFGEPRYPAAVGQSAFTFTLGNGLTFTRETQAAPPGSTTTLPLTFQFFGVISPTPFDRFTIAAGNPSVGLINGVAYTNITVAAVPEPATLALVAGGLLALGAGARRRRMH
jgi:hypothetical protein